MDKKKITEEKVKEILDKILNEDISKVNRNEFSRIQFKIDELQNSLNETIKEFRKLDDSIPNGLKPITKSKLSNIGSYLYNSQNLISQLKEKVRNQKRLLFSQQTEEKKK